MDRENRHYEMILRNSKGVEEKVYIMVKSDKTMYAEKENSNSEIMSLYPVLKELTSREYVEAVDNFKGKNIATSQGLESRIENMKE
jgi:hypothetical protein